MKNSTLQMLGMFIIMITFQLTGASSWAQIPEKMSYQAVVRNNSNQLVVNQKIGMQINILQGTESGAVVYSETQEPTTNANGLVTIEIGTGTSSDDFSTIDWSNGPYYISTSTDPAGGTSYTITGVSQLLSVPYALYAKNVENDLVDDADADPLNEIQTITRSGNTVSLSKEGGSVNIEDADADAANEIQALSISGTTLSLSKGGGSVTLPSAGSSDNWGTQTAVTDATLSGNGLTSTPLKLAQQSATTGQGLKWNGTTWKPGSVDSDSLNELQTLSISGSNISLSKGGGTISIPTSGGLTLPYTASGSFSGTPFSIENTGSGYYSIAGFSTSGYGIYGNSSATNGSGVLGLGTGTNFSSGVVGRSGEGTTTTIPGNCGVLGQANANLGVAGTAISGTGGYFSSQSGLALKTVGNVQLTGIGEGTGRVLTSDGSGNATWQTPSAGGLTLPFSGTVSNSSPAFQVTNTGSGEGIKGIASLAGETGIYGEAPTQGIFGHSTSASGAAYGVQGVSESTSGSGVTGYAASSSGSTYGLRGINSSSDGKGVYGYAGSSSGYTYGVYGEVVSGSGIGVYGISPYVGIEALGTGSGSYGVYSQGQYIGVEGYVTPTSGTTFGIVGVSLSSSGTGVYGSDIASSGTTYGVHGISSSASGIGVFGEGNTLGIKGSSSDDSGYGVLGSAPYIGVQGSATGTSGTNYGLYGTSTSSYGFGVYGYSPYVGIYGSCSGSSGWAGYFSGKVGISGNLGVGTAYPNYPLEVAGSANLNYNTTGVALRCNGSEAIWYNGTYYSWGYGGTWNYFGDKIFIGATAADPGSYLLVVNGTAAKPGGGSWSTYSDKRLKDIHGNYNSGLKEIIQLQPIIYSYKKDNPKNLPSDKNYVGFVAQDVQNVFPEAVTEETDGYLSLDMNSIDIAVINALKELNAENDKLKAENQELKDNIKEIYKRLAEIEK